MKYKSIIPLLEKAFELASTYCGGRSQDFQSPQDFRQALNFSIGRLRSGDTAQLRNLTKWFATSTTWDDYTGPDGQYLGQEIKLKLTEILSEKRRYYSN